MREGLEKWAIFSQQVNKKKKKKKIFIWLKQ